MFRKRPPTASVADPHALTREHVIWAYRLLLDRDPEDDAVIGPKLAGSRDTAELRRHLMASSEFRTKNPDYAQTNDPTVVIAELAGGVRLFVDLSDHAIGLNIVRRRYETDEIRFVRSVLEPGDTAIDVGAHIGFFTMQMAAAVGPTGRVLAFEPFAPNASLLERSVAENHFADRVVVHPAAVGAVAGTATLTFPVETLNSGGAYLVRDGSSSLAGHLTAPVAVLTLDETIAATPTRGRVRIIKMDVEGAEPQVIRGAARLLSEEAPLILSELHPVQLDRASGVTPDQFLAQLAAIGYRAHALEQGTIGAPIAVAPTSTLPSVVFVPRR